LSALQTSQVHHTSIMHSTTKGMSYDIANGDKFLW